MPQVSDIFADHCPHLQMTFPGVTPWTSGEIPRLLPGVIIPLTHSPSDPHASSSVGRSVWRHLCFAVIAQTREEVRKKKRGEMEISAFSGDGGDGCTPAALTRDQTCDNVDRRAGGQVFGQRSKISDHSSSRRKLEEIASIEKIKGCPLSTVICLSLTTEEGGSAGGSVGVSPASAAMSASPLPPLNYR